MENLYYRDGDIALTGKLAVPVGAARAAVVVFPTIMNIEPNVLRRAKMLAGQGYLALVADFYGVPVRDGEAAMALGNGLREDWGGYRDRIKAAISAMFALPQRGSLPVGVIGYCLGGQAALEAARMNVDIFAAASFHGLLSTQMPAQEPVRPRMLVCHGDADALVPRQQVAEFQAEMDKAGGNWHLHTYAKVKHGFTDPQSDSRGLPILGYDASADRQSWAALMSLFDEVFA